HRTLNIGLIGLTSAMAWGRSRRERPGWGYLALGAAGLAAMSYGAYLGGRMVYELGVGVQPAGGLHEAEAPEYGLTDAPEAARDMVSDAASGAAHAAEDARGGEVAPAL
ncbi:MAG TPA: DUF2231 domain-containing protein, partial [Longimicrobiales bacterium]|nr:DUF2231 domain-containing protein [Longimicrobiales bacterium]